MSIRYSIAPRSNALNGLFASLSCTIALTLTAGPALAAPGDLERVEVSGRMVEAPLRYDVRAGCANIETQLQDALQTTWMREQRAGLVRVQVVMDGGDIQAVDASGMSNIHERAVRQAVNGLQCGAQASSGAQIYRFSVAFVDPAAESAARTARATRPYRIALLSQ